MSHYQIIEMPKPGKEAGVKAVVAVQSVLSTKIDHIEIPFCCGIEKVIILYGDKYEHRKTYEKLLKKAK